MVIMVDESRRGLPRRHMPRTGGARARGRAVCAVGSLRRRARNAVETRRGSRGVGATGAARGLHRRGHRRPARPRTGRAAAPSRCTGARRPTIATAYLGSDERLRGATEQVVERRRRAGDHHRHRDPGLDRGGAELGPRPRAARRARRRPGAGPRTEGGRGRAGARARGVGHRARRADDRRARCCSTSSRRRPRRGAVLRRRHQRRRVVGSGAIRSPPCPCTAGSSPTDVRPAEALVRAALDGRVHAVTFTSAPAVRNLFAIAESTAPPTTCWT